MLSQGISSNLFILTLMHQAFYAKIWIPYTFNLRVGYVNKKKQGWQIIKYEQLLIDSTINKKKHAWLHVLDF